MHKRIPDRGALRQQEILGVRRQHLLVGRVRRQRRHARDEVLVKVDLADVRGRGAHERAVGGGRRVGVHHDVDVGCAAGVVPREEGFEEGDAVG